MTPASTPPFTGPLHIDAVTTPTGGAIGMVHCPGRCIGPWRRNLFDDLAAVAIWRPAVLVSLIEGHEFARLGVPGFAAAVGDAGIPWLHLPIADMQVPGGHFDQAWLGAGPVVMSALGRGDRVVLHCAAGLGRTGMIAAKLLIALGVDGPAAIRQVRAARPGTIETADQEQFVLAGRSLTAMS